MVAARKTASRQDPAITEEPDESLSRPQRRLLRRIYNGRTVPIVVDDRPFLTYKEASRYLLSLTEEARETAYSAMRRGAAAMEAGSDADAHSPLEGEGSN